MNSMSQRKYQIVKYLINKKIFLSSTELAEVFKVSNRTIKTDMKIIGLEEKALGIRLTIHPQKGYGVEIINLDLWQKNAQETKSKDYNLQADRVLYLLNQLLNTNDYQSFAHLQKEIFISSSTLKKDLELVKQLVSEEGLSLEQNKTKGLRIVGDEYLIRKMMSKYIDIDLNSIDSYNRMYASYVFSFTELKELTKYILRILNEEKIPLLGLDVTNILIHIIISSYRVKHGFQILNIHQFLPRDRVEHSIARKISEVLREKFKINLGDYEVDYLALTLSSKGVPNNTNYDEIKNLILDSYQSIAESYDIHFDINDDYSNALIYHVQAMKDRLSMGATIEAKVIEMVREKFVLAYEMSLIYQQHFLQKFNMELNNVELCYLALHFGAMLENTKIQQRLPRLFIISELRTGNVLLLKNECIANLGHLVHVVGVFSPYEINSLDLNASDILLTTEDNQALSRFRTLKIPTIFDEETVSRIRDFIKSDLLVNELFHSKLFFIEEQANIDIHTYLNDKAKYYKHLGFVEDAEEFFQYTLEREKIQGTRYANIVALPHPIHAISHRSFISTILFKTGVQWFDNEEVQLVFYIGIRPKEKNTTSSFQLLSRITSNPELIKEIMRVKQYEQFIEILRKIKHQEDIL